MAFERPTLAQLISRIAADIESELAGADGRLRRSAERAIGKALAGATHGLHGHLVELSAQLFPDTANEANARRWARILRGMEAKPAVQAEGSVVITGVNASECPAGTLWQRNDGVRYVQDALATITGGTATITVTALEAGSAGNADESSRLTLVTPVAGINAEALVEAPGITGGVDEEIGPALVARLLSSLRTPPKGGGPGDYTNWALEVPGVTRAWEFPRQLGEGTVVVLFVLDDAEDIIPDGPAIATVQAHLNTRRPVTAEVVAGAPIPFPLNPSIALTPDTPEVRAAVEAELVDLLRREAKPGGAMLLSRINEAISLAEGEVDHVLSSPVADVEPAELEIVTLGTITWE